MPRKSALKKKKGVNDTGRRRVGDITRQFTRKWGINQRNGGENTPYMQLPLPTPISDETTPSRRAGD
ncbi:hypothetical protein J437_LFUL001115 [Ladona fulva]|uniref:Uncharacterized protein n=1 Tax=Ladona fulva TaxID=123851 RepID=A0A8K0K148_LADFU|nr:hypothetical protein J437_LFUL001115 [Ladona fulva]